MQVLTRNIVSFFLIIITQTVYCSVNELDINIKKGDNYFEKGKYQQADSVFSHLINDKHAYTPQMLLKLAYIKERQNAIPMALYYLNLYHIHEPSVKTIKKMETLALHQNLSGYSFSDLEYLITFYYEYHQQIIIILVVMVVLVFMYNLLRWYFTTRYSTRRSVILIIVASIAIYLFNYGLPFYRAIVKSDHVLLMNAASSGSAPVNVISSGNRLTIVGSNDIWYRVLWHDSIVYIRKNNVMLAKEEF